MQSTECPHKINTHPHTRTDGRVIKIRSCCRCGMEWEPKEAQQ
jgi:hypothetical protein